MDAAAPRYRNRLLAKLPPDELALLAPHLEYLELKRRQLLYDVDRPIEHVYFIERGIASVLSVVKTGSAVETATIGFDGMIGMAVFHGVDSTPEQAMTQVPGAAHRIEAGAFRALLPRLPALDALLHRFSVFMFTLAAQNSGCNRMHAVEQRCARWLLIVRDRMDTDDVGLTHDFISQMLGVRRASVTDTLAALERRALIRTGRSKVTILDRAGLEAIACECYRIITATSERLLEGKPVPSPLAGTETSKNGFSTVGDGTPEAWSLDEPKK